MGAHEASSVYSEKKAQILRRVSDSVEEKNSELAAYESNLNLDKNILSAMLVRQCIFNYTTIKPHQFNIPVHEGSSFNCNQQW